MKDIPSFLKNITLIVCGLLVFLSLVSFTSQDISLISAPVSGHTHNLIGLIGAYLAFVLISVFGYAAYFLPFFLFFSGVSGFEGVRFYGLGKGKFVTTISFWIFWASLASLAGLLASQDVAAWKFGGMAGFFISRFMLQYLGFHGALISFSALMLVSAVLLFGLFFVDAAKGFPVLISGVGSFFAYLKNNYRQWKEDQASLTGQDKKKPAVKEEKVKPILKDMAELKAKINQPQNIENKEKPQVKPEIKVYSPTVSSSMKLPSVKSADAAAAVQTDAQKEAAKKKMEELEKQAGAQYDPASYKLPAIDLIKVPPAQDGSAVREDIEANIKNLEETLLEFGVEAKVVSVQKGPVVTMYELEPSTGVKIQQITSLSDDIALAMKSSSVRIVAPIPGRGTVGIEIPNEKKCMVYLREVLEDPVFTGAQSKLTMVIGKDVSGNPIVADLKDMPHLLIAGATGAGKTVCVNSLIISILYKAKPDEVKLILVDPKMVELASYAGIPHLLHPVICEAKKAFVALNWAVEEMERRYRVLAAKGSRNIDMYNKAGDEKLPYIVIMIDELADLMLVARENVETSIQRLAQLSRAVGIHLVLATQRPSVDVITGVIKANFPARISFKVSAKVDSRTVLDAMGADKLLGKGDLLFLKPGAVKLIRAQGSFIDDEDLENVTKFVRAQGAPVYEKGISEREKQGAMNVEEDEMIDQAINTVMQSRQASASILQRRLRVGYTRAARLLDLMEQKGIVGPFCGSKAREILVDPQSYLAGTDPIQARAPEPSETTSAEEEA